MIKSFTIFAIVETLEAFAGNTSKLKCDVSILLVITYMSSKFLSFFYNIIAY